MYESEREALLVDALEGIRRMRKAPVQMVRAMCRREVALVTKLAGVTEASAATQDEIAQHTLRFSAIHKSPLLTQFDEYCSLLDCLESDAEKLMLRSLDMVKDLTSELRAKQSELIAKKKRELDYAEVVRLATDDAVSSCKSLLFKLSHFDARCSALESRLKSAEIDLSRHLQPSRKATDPRRPPGPALWSPKAPAKNRHRHTLSIGNATPLGTGLSAAVDCLDAMNERVEALAILFNGDFRREQIDGLQTCVVSHRFRTLLQVLERWRLSK